ncbi:MAG: hypothetical protein LBI48_11390 [Burkholderiaceae bacterium]|jgi:hypothetical protein|nr:hypothetical protein [Burkholderiaceae bacterium]
MLEKKKSADPNELREQAKLKAQAAKAKLAQVKLLKANKPPQYVEEPEYTGDGEIDDAADLAAVESGFKKRAKDENLRFALATDSEYWACLCFQTREQKEAFLSALKLLALGDKYIDGQQAAKVLGIDLPAANVPYNTSGKIDKTWAGFVD